MTSMVGRVQTAEQRIARWGSPRYVVLGRHLSLGTFSSEHVDRLFDIIHEPFKAAMLTAVASLVEIHHYFTGTAGTVLSDFAMYLAFPRIGFSPQVNEDEVLARCERVLRLPETVRSHGLLPEVDNRYRVQRGLAQRLVNIGGVEALRSAAWQFMATPEEGRPLPVMNRGERKRLLALVEPLQSALDCRLLLWRNEDGTPGWTYSET